MREINKQIQVSRMTSETVIAVSQEIDSIIIEPKTKTMSISLTYYDATGLVVSPAYVMITGSDYDLLFSDDEFFKTGKQVGSYREVDLWTMIDKVG